MAGRPAQHEHVPDRVAEDESFLVVEEDAGAVGHATGHQPGDAGGRQVLHQGLEGHDDDPPHGDVQARHQAAHAPREHGLYHDPRGGQPPDDPEDRPAPGPAHAHEREGRVGAGDQQVDGRVVEDLEDALGPRPRDGVVEGRRQVQQDQAGPVDAAGHHVSRGPVERRQHDEHRQRRDTERGSQPMQRRVRDLLVPALRDLPAHGASVRPARNEGSPSSVTLVSWAFGHRHMSMTKVNTFT